MRLLEVKVKEIIDADGIVVSTSRIDISVRLDAIDCPEVGQPGWEAATECLSRLVKNQQVYMELHGHDRYGRTLAVIYVMDGSELINVNQEMVKCGHAWVMRMYYTHLSKGRQRALNILERWAKSKRVGLWKLDNPIPPWEWRNRKSA